MGWASALPFFFWASPAQLACWGSWGFAPCVRVFQLRCCLLGLQVRSPCCPSLTLEWACFWPKVSQVFVGCKGGLGCPSWFVILFLCLLVLHLFWGWGGLVTGLWPLLRLLVLDSSDARLHCPDALASGRTLSFCRRGSLPWAFIRPGVSRPRPCLGSSLLLGGAHLPLSWVFAWRLWPLDCPGTCSLLGLTLGSSLLLPVLAAGLGWLGFILGCPPSVASLRRLLPWFFVGYLLDARMKLLCFWTPGSCGVPSLHIRSPVSGPVWVLPQSTIVTLLSLLWLGLLLVVVRFHCLRLTLWPSACVGPPGCPAFSGLPPCSFSSVFLRDVVTLWGH